MRSAYEIANAFIVRAKEGRLADLSSMKLQKLMFCAQAWHLKVKGVPFFHDTFVRGMTGPVLPSIHFQLITYGDRPALRTIKILSEGKNPAVVRVPTLPDEERSAWDLIDAVIRRYGGMSAAELSDMTHLPGSAWSQGPVDSGAITNDVILNDPTFDPWTRA